MQKVYFTSYGIPSPGYAPAQFGVLDHTFVVSSTSNQITNQSQVLDNWNCWGRGKDAIGQGAQQLSQGTALAQWANIIYGNDGAHPTGLIEKVEGVCQNAANRVLVLAGVDVSAANANMYVILLYGKYGFHISDFVNNVKTAAAQVNASQPGAISDSDLQTVLNRIADDPEDELGTLEKHFLSSLPNSLTSAQQSDLLAAYKNFQAQREATFEQEWPNRNDPNYQADYAKLLEPVFLSAAKQFLNILGPENYQSIFKSAPQQVLPYLLKLQ